MEHRGWKFNGAGLAILGMLLALALAFQLPVSASADGPNLAGTWHRLNAYPGASPEHEVLRCGGNSAPRCIYDKQPEPGLGFPNPPDSAFGRFRGQDVTESWECPALMDGTGICEGVTFVARGVMRYVQADGTKLVADHELIVTVMDGQTRLYVYWPTAGFACPWFSSFADALAANPDWPAGDCIAPG